MTTEAAVQDDASEASESVWIRLQVPTEVHQTLKQKAKAEKRGIIEFVTSLLVDVAQGNYAIGQPARSPSSNYSMIKPSEQPLSTYAAEAQELVLLGTTLRSLEPFADFIHERAAAGTRLTFLLADEDALRATPEFVRQVSIRQARPVDDVLRQLVESTQRLAKLKCEFPNTVTVIRLPIVPNFGLTIVDPFRSTAKLRVSLYLFMQPPQCNPVLHIEPSTAEARFAFNLFMDHYVRLVTQARGAMDAQPIV